MATFRQAADEADADGLPVRGTYATLLRTATDPAALLARVEAAPTPLPDGWQAQIQAQIQRTAAVYLVRHRPREGYGARTRIPRALAVGVSK